MLMTIHSRRFPAARRLVFAALLTAAAGGSVPAAAQPLSVKLFRDQPYFEPLLAEPRPARTMLLIPAWSKEFPHSVEKGNRFAWHISLGDELPILTASTQSSAGPMEKGRWGAGLWIPISFHVVEDFKDTSNPIVDTDYRFGFMAKVQYGWSGNLRLGIRFVPWAHESTHLGDEYVILAIKDPSFERVNVSYERWEYGISLEGSGLFDTDDNWTIRHGGLRPWNKDGYYSNHLLGSDLATLTPSIKNYEPSFGFEYRAAEWHGRQTYVSADVRHQLVYTYHQTLQNPEQQQWSLNLQVGRAVAIGTTGTPLKQYFVQLYRGVNPYGQLRSQKDYWSAGFGWVFGL
jgi:hypothetical protein